MILHSSWMAISRMSVGVLGAIIRFNLLRDLQWISPVTLLRSVLLVVMYSIVSSILRLATARSHILSIMYRVWLPPVVNDCKVGEPHAHIQGLFSCRGFEGFYQMMNQYELKIDYHCLSEGFILSFFQRLPLDLILSFVIIDVDHFQRTRDSLE